MGFKCGIVGLPNVGKSTLFNALTASKNAEAANFPFCTIDPNIGVVPVPDDRLDKLSSLLSTTSTIPMLGSIVQKGKFAASAFFEAVRALNKVDFPTLGSPTIPHLKPIKILINLTREQVYFFINESGY